MERTTVTGCSTFEWIRVSNQFFRMCWNTAGTNSLLELLQLQLHVYNVFIKISRVPWEYVAVTTDLSNCLGFQQKSSKSILSFWVCRLRLAVSWVVKILAKDPKSWRQMDPSWRWPISQRCRRSVGRSSCKPKKPSFWDSENFFSNPQSAISK